MAESRALSGVPGRLAVPRHLSFGTPNHKDMSGTRGSILSLQLRYPTRGTSTPYISRRLVFSHGQILGPGRKCSGSRRSEYQVDVCDILILNMFCYFCAGKGDHLWGESPVSMVPTICPCSLRTTQTLSARTNEVSRPIGKPAVGQKFEIWSHAIEVQM